MSSSFKIVLEQEYGQGPNHYFLNANGKSTQNGVVPAFDKSGGSVIKFEHAGKGQVFYLKSNGNYLGAEPRAVGVYPHTKEMFTPLVFGTLPPLAKDKKNFQFLLEDISSQFGAVLRNIGTGQVLSYVGEGPYLAALVHYNIGVMRLVGVEDNNVVQSPAHFDTLVTKGKPAPSEATGVIPLHSDETPKQKLTTAAIAGIVVGSILLLLLIIFLIMKFKK